jgi:hypothetical protein
VRALEDKTDGDYLSVSASVRLAYKPYFLTNKQYFSLTKNQLTVLSAMTFEPSV